MDVVDTVAKRRRAHVSAWANDDRDGLGRMLCFRTTWGQSASQDQREGRRGGGEEEQGEVSEKSGMRRRIVGKGAPVNECVPRRGPAVSVHRRGR